MIIGSHEGRDAGRKEGRKIMENKTRHHLEVIRSRKKRKNQNGDRNSLTVIWKIEGAAQGKDDKW